MRLKIKMIQRPSLEVEIADDATLSALRDKIFEATQIPVMRQRLIFQGKALVSDNRLVDYGLRDGLTLHMVERPVDGRIQRLVPSRGAPSSSRYPSRLRSSGGAGYHNVQSERPRFGESNSFTLSAEMNIPRISTWLDVQRSAMLVRQAMRNVLGPLTESTSSTMRVLDGYPRQGDVLISVRIYGNCAHILDSSSRSSLLRAAETLYRCQMTLEQLKSIPAAFFEPVDCFADRSMLLMFCEVILNLEEISEVAHAECVSRLLGDTGFSNPVIDEEGISDFITSVSDNQDRQSDTQNHNIFYRHSNAVDFEIVCQKMFTVERQLEEALNQYSNLLRTFSSRASFVQDSHRYVLRVFQEHIQRVMRRMTQVNIFLTQIRFDFSSDPLLSNLPSTTRGGSGHDWTSADVSIYFRHTSESPRTEVPTSTTFEVVTRSRRVHPSLMEESYENERWLNRSPPILTRAVAGNAVTNTTNQQNNNEPSPSQDSFMSSSVPLPYFQNALRGSGATRRFRFSGPYLTATFGLLPSSSQSGNTRETRGNTEAVPRPLFGIPVPVAPPSNPLVHGGIVSNVPDVARMDFFHFAFGMQRPRSGQAVTHSSPGTIRRFLSRSLNQGQQGRQNAENPVEAAGGSFPYITRAHRRNLPENAADSFEYINCITTIFELLNTGVDCMNDENKYKAGVLKGRLQRLRRPQTTSDNSSHEFPPASNRLTGIIENVLRRVIIGFINAHGDPSIALELMTQAQEDEPFEHQFTLVGDENSGISELEMHEFFVPDNGESHEQEERSTGASDVEPTQENNSSEEMMQVDEPIEETPSTMEMETSEVSANVEQSTSASTTHTHDTTDIGAGQNWRQVLPQNWLEVIGNDRFAEVERNGFSDAYLSSGLNPKKLEERLSGQTDLLLAIMNDTFHETSAITEIGAPSNLQRDSMSSEILEVLRTAFDSLIAKRLLADTDFDAEKFPELQKFTLKM